MSRIVNFRSPGCDRKKDIDRMKGEEEDEAEVSEQEKWNKEDEDKVNRRE